MGETKLNLSSGEILEGENFFCKQCLQFLLYLGVVNIIGIIKFLLKNHLNWLFKIYMFKTVAVYY